ncbi:alpha-amylase family glycosyl hydrolase [Neolewinella persica]|uniref:alpha-amylase family glycosyl hydrolase n=1 Tax=Neolewinella persica TaxID=70998 RepID=UPI00036A1377|nr:alpha-amylase family glycosyl hydrolase [Neolewinella persica]
MQKTIFALLLLISGLTLSAQDFMLQGWYWDYDKDGCNGYAGQNWATRLNADVTTLANAGFTFAWLPPASRASFGKCSNGYDPQDLYDLGDDIDPTEAGQERTGFGTRAEVDVLIANLTANGIAPVADVVYNHRDGGAAEDNPAVKAYVETHFNGNGKQPFPSDRYRNRLPLGGTYGAGDYFIKLSSKTQSFGANQYKFYATVASMDKPFAGAVNESEPNGGGDCGQPFNTVLLDQDMVGTLFDFSGCYTDEFRLTISAADFDPAGDDLIITMVNVSGGYSDHRIYDIYYAPEDGAPGFNIPLADLRYQTFTDFTTLPSGQGGMNFENFRPNSTNTSTTFMAGDFDSPLFFYDVVQAETSTATVYNDWTHWLLNDVGFGGLRMDAIKHFPPGFVAQLLDDLAERGHNPGMVVGEFFDSNPTLLKDWVDAVNADITASTSLVRIFDFSLRNALKEACDNGFYDLREVYNSSLYDNGLSGFNVVTFLNNHDFRGPGEPIQNNPILGYAYLLTNNQLGVPTVFYPEFAGVTIPNAPTFDLSTEIAELIQIHKDHIFGAGTVEYLNRFGTPRAANYQQSNASEALIYQISGGPGLGEVIVAINFGDGTLKVDQEIAVPVASSANGLSFTELTGNAFNTTTSTDGSNRILIDVPAKSYAVYVATALLPVELADFRASLDEKGRVNLKWETVTEEALDLFVVEASDNGVGFSEVARVAPEQAASLYQAVDDRPWMGNLRYYRLKTLSLDGTVQRSVVRRIKYAPGQTLTASPNPAEDEVIISGISSGQSWALLAANGRQVAVTGRETARGFTLDLRHVSPGLYLFRSGGEVVKVIVR